jgi:hypothetical protein
VLTKDEFMIRCPDMYAEIKLEGYQKGLADGQEKKKKADEYPLSGFISSCCILTSRARSQGGLLYGCFKDWYRKKLFNEQINPNAYELVPTATWFGRQLNKKFKKLKSGGFFVYKGIRRK